MFTLKARLLDFCFLMHLKSFFRIHRSKFLCVFINMIKKKIVDLEMYHLLEHHRVQGRNYELDAKILKQMCFGLTLVIQKLQIVSQNWTLSEPQFYFFSLLQQSTNARIIIWEAQQVSGKVGGCIVFLCHTDKLIFEMLMENSNCSLPKNFKLHFHKSLSLFLTGENHFVMKLIIRDKCLN